MIRKVICINSVLVVLIAAALFVYPAVRAARLEPLETLRLG